MSSSTLFRIAGSLLALMPIGHTQMASEIIFPGLKPLGGTVAAYSSKVSWTQANGYFIISALSCFRWASTGVQPGWDTYTLWALLATQVSAGAAYGKKGVMPPLALYWAISMLMGVAAFNQK